MKTTASLVAGLVLAIAGSASAGEARIAWSDLDLSTTAGVAAFDARVDAAARRMCRAANRGGSRILDRAGCYEAIRDEAVSQLPRPARVEYAQNRVPVAA